MTSNVTQRAETLAGARKRNTRIDRDRTLIRLISFSQPMNKINTTKVIPYAPLPLPSLPLLLPPPPRCPALFLRMAKSKIERKKSKGGSKPWTNEKDPDCHPLRRRNFFCAAPQNCIWRRSLVAADEVRAACPVRFHVTPKARAET